MPLQINLKGSGGGQGSEPRNTSEAESNNTHRSSPAQVNARHQYSDAPVDAYGLPPQYQVSGPPPGEYYQSPYTYFDGMSSQLGAQLPPPPPPHYWYSHASVVDSNWKLISSPLVTKKAQTKPKDWEVACNSGMQQSEDSQEQLESSPGNAPLHIPKRNSSGNAGPPIMAGSPLQEAPAPPPPFYAQGPYYSMPPPYDHAPYEQHPHQWQYPPHVYPYYPPSYQAGPYPPYPIPQYASQPRLQSPAVSGQKQFGAARNTKKRSRPTSLDRFVPPKELSNQTTSKKKKMYSDFVGVTYNLTHSKYQACITHYRKQHYLGRYKFAVDAALAYDESAKVLKGPNWKVNFPTMNAYKKARKEEMKRVGRIGDKDTDIEQSKEAEIVASRIAQLAASLKSHANDKAPKPAPKQSDKASKRKSKEKCGEVVRFKHPLDGTSKRMPGGKKTPFAPLHMTDDSEGKSKVTPCQFEPEDSPSTSSEIDEKLPSSQSDANKGRSCDKAATVENTPQPGSPDPTRHTHGVDKSTPESAIKPKVLQYQGSVAKKGDTSNSSRLSIAPKTTAPKTNAEMPAIGQTAQNEKATTNLRSGQLAAASALMTLHQKEDA